MLITLLPHEGFSIVGFHCGIVFLIYLELEKKSGMEWIWKISFAQNIYLFIGERLRNFDFVNHLHVK